MLRGLYNLKISDHRAMDTHEMAKLYRPKGNSLDVWAREFGIQRRKFLGSPTWTPFVSQHWSTPFHKCGDVFLALSAMTGSSSAGEDASCRGEAPT